jgi:NAD(P)-dependent dehydrogenase (short-subunit alcohol dehydrogenase family)
MQIEFRGKVGLITGASSGIGRATALRFAQSGARLMLTGRHVNSLEALQKKINTDGVKCNIELGDITDADFRQELIRSLENHFGQLDILVNAAGIIATGSIETTKLGDFDHMMDINLRSVFHLIQLSLPLLIKSKGNIVNVSSITGLRSFPGILSYSVSKAGVDQLTRVAALELAERGVRVNAVNPGVVETNLHKRSGFDQKTYENFLLHSQTTHPLGRVGQPDEIARLIAFLASANASWITGLTTSIDGGRHLTCAR